MEPYQGLYFERKTCFWELGCVSGCSYELLSSDVPALHQNGFSKSNGFRSDIEPASFFRLFQPPQNYSIALQGRHDLHF